MLIGGSNIESRHLPFVTFLLILVNVGVFVKSYTLECQASRERREKVVRIWRGQDTARSLVKNKELNEFYQDWGFSMPDLTERGEFMPILTHMFVHGGLGHIVGNLVMLWAFGLAMEEAMGSLVFGLFYIVCGLAAAFGQAFCDMSSDIPCIGASGAIAGVMGGFFILFGTTAKLKILIFIMMIPRWISVPAWLFGILWVGSQLLNFAESGASGGGVAWMAHIAGCGIGALFVLIMRSDLDAEVESNDDGTIHIKKREKEEQLSEQDLLEQVLDCQSVDIVVDYLLGEEAVVQCPDCQGELDVSNPLSNRLVRCLGCGATKYVDAELLMHGRDIAEMNF